MLGNKRSNSILLHAATTRIHPSIHCWGSLPTALAQLKIRLVLLCFISIHMLQGEKMVSGLGKELKNGGRNSEFELMRILFWAVRVEE